MDGADVIRRFRSATANRDFATAAGLIHPDLTFHTPRPGVVLSRDKLLQMWSEPEEEREHLTTELEPAEVEELPDGRYFSTTREINRWRESGEIASTTERAAIWRLRDAKIDEIRIFPTVEAGRAAALQS